MPSSESKTLFITRHCVTGLTDFLPMLGINLKLSLQCIFEMGGGGGGRHPMQALAVMPGQLKTPGQEGAFVKYLVQHEGVLKKICRDQQSDKARQSSEARPKMSLLARFFSPPPSKAQ